MLIETISSGVVEINLPCYALMAWFNGQWNIVNVSPCSEEGYTSLENEMNSSHYNEMNIVRYD